MTYIAIALTVLVVTQIIRLVQNAKQLRHMKENSINQEEHAKWLRQMKDDFDAVIQNEIDR